MCIRDRSLGLKEAGVLADFFHMSIEETDYRESILYAGAVSYTHLDVYKRQQ